MVKKLLYPLTGFTDTSNTGKGTNEQESIRSRGGQQIVELNIFKHSLCC